MSSGKGLSNQSRDAETTEYALRRNWGRAMALEILRSLSGIEGLGSRQLSPKSLRFRCFFFFPPETSQDF